MCRAGIDDRAVRAGIQIDLGRIGDLDPLGGEAAQDRDADRRPPVVKRCIIGAGRIEEQLEIDARRAEADQPATDGAEAQRDDQ